ncbi:MAG: M4 family metallopeptidase [Candidatus Brocadiaceae bacterium]|nr:M4 family metallopeptidase [Candidatus Brocadiaceae bacterium]
MIKFYSIFLVLLVLVPGAVMAGNDVPFEKQRIALEELKNNVSKEVFVKWNKKKGIAKYVSGRLTTPSDLSAEELSKAFIAQYRVLFGINDCDKELELIPSDITLKASFIHYKQKRNGLDVVGGKITVRLNDGIVTTVANSFEPHISIKTTPEISPENAMEIARAAVEIQDNETKVSLLVFPWEDKHYLTYRVDFCFHSGQKPTKYRVYVDAITGDIILVENRIMHEGASLGSGIGVDGALKIFDTYERGGIFFLGNLPIPQSEITIKTYDAHNTENLPGSIVRDDDNTWEDPAGIDAHFYGNVVFDFYRDNFGNFSWFSKSGFKQSGGLVSSVHYGVNFENAFWEGRQMVYGDGDKLFRPFSGALDVVAHEITHGITEAINDLLYCSEPGALNESWSDIMGMFVSISYGDDLPYWSAEEIIKIDETSGFEAFYALRRMDDPPFRTDAFPDNDYDSSDPLNSWGQPEHTSEQYFARCFPWTDNGGVHVNSGIPNKAAYLITLDIGSEKAQEIYYYAMFYLSTLSLFQDARDAVEQSTIDLFGVGPELTSVQNAFDAVGIGP